MISTARVKSMLTYYVKLNSEKQDSHKNVVGFVAGDLDTAVEFFMKSYLTFNGGRRLLTFSIKISSMKLYFDPNSTEVVQ